MKQFKYILSALALLLPVLAFAQPAIYEDYKIDNGVATGKSVGTVDDNNQYTLTLETFATGISSSINVGVPVDIVLVLDVSGSMSENMTTYTYTARTSQSYSYSSYGNHTYYYKHTDDKYYPVSSSAEYDGSGGRYSWDNYYTRLSYTADDGVTYYLSGTGTTTTPPTNVKGNTSTIWTGVLYSATATTQSKLAALKTAVSAFVDVVNHDANYSENGPRVAPVHNQISIVKYAMNRYYDDDEESIEPGDHNYYYSYNVQNANYTEVVVSFTDVSTTAGANAVKGVGTALGVQDLHAAGATASDYGMTKAKYLLNQDEIKNRESNKVVVLFTDGEPTYGNSFNDDVANNTIALAKELKETYGATVFTVGVFTSGETDDIATYMHHTSSDYPHAQSMTVPGADGSDDKGYYQNATKADLTSIFTSIAHQSGASEKTIPGETMLVDAVSTSFEVPSTFKAEDVVVYTRDVMSDGSDWDESTIKYLKKAILPESYDLNQLPPSNVSYMTSEDSVGVYLHNGKLMIIGFNYSKPDTEEDGSAVIPYDGNWVGFRTEDANSCAGRELVVEFKVTPQDSITGGDGTNTNDLKTSGVYVPIYEDGVFKGYQNVNNYPYPQTDLPVNIVIQKNGLRRGESATIQIYRAPVLKNEFDDKTGKPKPDLTNGWSNFTKVILTNIYDDDNHPVSKTLLCLDPAYVYKLEEDNWSWGYDLDTKSVNTSEQDHNPFVFNNTLRTDAVKHAEAVSVNIFGDNYGTKSYKASKVQSFSNTGNDAGSNTEGSE